MHFEDNTPRSPYDDLKLSLLFHTVLSQLPGPTVRVGQLVEAFHERGFGVLLILFSLPMCIPIPKPPPIDTILGVPLFYLCLQMILGRDTPRLPKKILDYEVPVDLMVRAFARGCPKLERFESMFRPRLTHILSDNTLSRICGVLGMGLTASVLVPFPLSNTVPSLCMVTMAMGILSRDALAAIAAGLAGVAWVIGLATITVLGGQMIAEQI